MSEVLHADIFFFITGIAVIVFSSLLCVALFHGIKAMKSLRRILARIEEGTEVIAEDLGQLRAYFSEDGFVKRFIKSMMGMSSEAPEKEGRTKAKKPEKKRTELEIKG
ncbi:MAG: hypothetical protein WAW13_03010 [Minisyncoccia bacterium]